MTLLEDRIADLLSERPRTKTAPTGQDGSGKKAKKSEQDINQNPVNLQAGWNALKWRKKALALGWRLVPLKGKACFWSGWPDSHATADDIKDWYENHVSWTNTGTALGDNFVAIDIDVQDETVASELLAAFRAIGNGQPLVRHGKGSKVTVLWRTAAPVTRAVTHAFLSADGLKHQVEILTGRRQIVVDGIHPDTGKPYTWEDDRSPATIKPFALPFIDIARLDALMTWADTKMANQPGWTQQPGKAGKEEPRRAEKREDPTAKSGIVGSFNRAYTIKSAIETFLSKAYVKKKGNRYAWAGGTGNPGAEIIDDGKILRCNDANDPCHGQVNAFDLVRLHLFGDGDQSFKAMARFAESDSKVRQQRDDETGSKFDEAAVRAKIDFMLDTGPTFGATRHGLHFLTGGDYAQMPFPDYVVEGLIHAGEFGCLFSAPGIGKSMWACHAGYNVSLGKPVNGRETQKGVVFYIAAESPDSIGRRMWALDEIHKEPAPDFKVISGVKDLFSPESTDVKNLRLAIAEDKPVLIFIDTLAAAFPGLIENDADSMARVAAVVKTLQEHGAAVIVLHHGTKAEGTTPRGSGALLGSVEMALRLVVEGEFVMGEMTKGRDIPTKLNLAFTIGSIGLGVDSKGKPRPVGYVVEADTSEVMAAAKAELPESEQKALDLLTKLGPNCTEKEWKTEGSKPGVISDSVKPISCRDMMTRAARELKLKHLIRVRDDGVVMLLTDIDSKFDDEDSMD